MDGGIMKNLFKELKTLLNGLSGKIIYMPNSGNWGDELIREGTLKFFDDINLNYKEIKYTTMPQLPKNCTFIYGGGGAWCKQWNHGRAIVKNAVSQCNQVIVLPSTYAVNIPKSPNIIYFARDKFQSFDYCPKAILCPDMALYLDKIYLKSTMRRGFFYRTDDEAVRDFRLPLDNRDISLEQKHLYPCASFIEGIGRYEQINTDRLHVAIAGYLLDREVFLKTSNYHKIPAFYNTWFKNNKNISLVFSQKFP